MYRLRIFVKTSGQNRNSRLKYAILLTNFMTKNIVLFLYDFFLIYKLDINFKGTEIILNKFEN